MGAGVMKKETTCRPLASLIPRGVDWMQKSVAEIDPKKQFITCSDGSVIKFEYLVVATGLKLDFEKIKGVAGMIGSEGLCSIYDYQQAEKTANMLSAFRGGTAIFTMSPVPIKCAGAPQKIMYLADEIFRKNNVRDISKIIFTVAGKVMFGVTTFATALIEVAKAKGIEVKFGHRLTEVDLEKKIATFEVLPDMTTGAIAETAHLAYDLLHVVPPMSTHDFVRNSGLAANSGAQTGWLKVDRHTLQHEDFSNIFGIGDVTGVPNSKTGAAVSKQAPVVAANLISAIHGHTLKENYDGYSSCPLITGFGKVILAEFGYEGKLMPSFPLDMTKERRSMWLLKKYLLPKMYWNAMMRGRM